MVFGVLQKFRLALFRQIAVDNFVFHLHYRWTVIILLVLSLFVTCRLFVGHSFACYGRSDLPTRYVDHACYASTVSTVQNDLAEEIKGKPVNATEKITKHHKYYAWVNIVLLIQAFMFYVPHALWRYFEKGYMYRLTSGIDIISAGNRKNLELCVLAKYITVTQGQHTVYVLTYVFLEMLNFVITVLQTVLLVSFFQITEIPDGWDLDLSSWTQFTKYHFPQKGRCTIHLLGSSGDMQRHDMLCLLPMNELYCYIFNFLYGWYVTLAILSALVLIYRGSYFLFPGVRNMTLSMGMPHHSSRFPFETAFKRMSCFDVFFLKCLKDNMLDSDFMQLIEKLTASSNDKINLEVINEGCKDDDNPATATNPT